MQFVDLANQFSSEVRVIKPGDEPFNVEDESKLIFSGFVAFLDPPKETTAEALRLWRPK